MSEIKLAATPRTEFGKGAARRTRRAHQVPAVIYGHGQDPQHIALPGHETMLALKTANALISVAIEGAADVLTLVKDVQRDPVKQIIEHVDLLVVRRGEKVEVEVAVHITGEAAPETVVTLENQNLVLEVEATHIPESVEVSVEGLRPGTQVHAGSIALPEGATLVTDAETLVVHVTAQVTAEALDAELAEAEAELGIEHEATDAEKAEAVEQTAAADEAGDSAGSDDAS